MPFRFLLNPAYTSTLNITPEQLDKQVVLTIGNYDGVHRGHQGILQQLIEKAESFNALSAVMLFEPQPLEFFQKQSPPVRLMSLRQKVETLFDLGVHQILVCRFNSEFAALSPENFVKVMLEALNRRYQTLMEVIVGDDFCFGAQRKGNFDTLVSLGRHYQFKASSLESIQIDQHRVSSSMIRDLVVGSHFKAAADMLGRNYQVCGKIGYGRQLGRNLHVPTANLKTALPRPALQGVYVGRAFFRDFENDILAEGIPAIGNFGFRPSVDGQTWKAEVHLLEGEYGENALYGQRLAFQPLHKLREEQSFDSLESLREAIRNDIAHAIQYFEQVKF